MKRLATALLPIIGLGVGAGQIASAADLPLKAPPMVAAPVPFSWTGAYIGLGAGFRASRADASSVDSFAGVPVIDPLGPSRWPIDGIAFRANPYAGFNLQVAPRWVVGLEGDVGFADQTTTRAGFIDPFFNHDNSADGFSVRTTWDASVRGRVGFLATPTTLFYATGGAAWQHYDVTSTCASTTLVTFNPVIGYGNCASIAPSVITNSTTRPGWTVGGGIEAAFWGNWVVRGEYRYSDFGHLSSTFTRSTTFIADNPIVATTDVALRTHIATFGIAYKFGDPIVGSDPGGPLAAVPVKATPPASMSWSGFYGGLGLGVRESRADATTTSITLNGVPQGLANAAVSQPMDGSAFRADPYLGFNWQVAPRWLVGIEGDAGIARQTTMLAGFKFSPGFGGAFILSNSFALQTKWDASARGRLGFLITPTLLAYATGGAAWQSFNVTSTCITGDCANGLGPAVIANSATKVGWTVGSGIEAALWGHWLARAEYRYADYGTSSSTIARTGGPAGVFNAQSQTDTYVLALRTHSATLGLAYKF